MDKRQTERGRETETETEEEGIRCDIKKKKNRHTKQLNDKQTGIGQQTGDNRRSQSENVRENPKTSWVDKEDHNKWPVGHHLKECKEEAD